MAIDAISAFHFFQTWSAFSRDGDGAATELPCHDRTLLRARSPPVDLPADALSVINLKLTLCEPSVPIACESFVISRDQTASLKRLCGDGASTFSALGALVWQCACLARRLPRGAETCLTLKANVRHVLRPRLPDRYFGNALVWLRVDGGTVGDIAAQPLPTIAGRIRGAIRRMDDELVRSAADLHEVANRAERDGSSTRKVTGNLPETELVVVSWLGMPVYDADFGWGKPRAECVRGGSAFFLPADRSGSGAVRVLVCMETAKIKEFQRLLYAKI